MSPINPEFAPTRACARAHQPRLLTVEQTARYLGYTTTAALKNLPIQPIRLAAVGAGCSPKYDRHAIDRWLDGLSGLAEPPTPSPAPATDDADQEFKDWELRRARRA